jgi:type III restriction enzyme
MNLQFEHDLDYQRAAIDAVCGLFMGQERYSLAADAASRDLAGQVVQQQMGLGLAESELGIGNRLSLLDDDLLKNLNAVQLCSCAMV